MNNYVGVYSVGRQPYVQVVDANAGTTYYYTNYTDSQVGKTASNWQIVSAPQLIESFVYKFMAKATGTKYNTIR